MHSTFESDVVPDSGKTEACDLVFYVEFESDVVPDSGKTCDRPMAPTP